MIQVCDPPRTRQVRRLSAEEFCRLAQSEVSSVYRPRSEVLRMHPAPGTPRVLYTPHTSPTVRAARCCGC